MCLATLGNRSTSTSSLRNLFGVLSKLKTGTSESTFADDHSNVFLWEAMQAIHHMPLSSYLPSFLSPPLSLSPYAAAKQGYCVNAACTSYACTVLRTRLSQSHSIDCSSWSTMKHFLAIKLETHNEYRGQRISLRRLSLLHVAIVLH